MARNLASCEVSLASPTRRRAEFGLYPCQGVYHTPAGAQPKTAFIATHYTADFTHHYLASYMAQRGYGFLGWNTRYRGGASAAGFMLEHALIDIGVGVRWLREVAGVETVIVVGNSGGASLMGVYQAQAVSPNLDPGSAPPEVFDDLPAADMYLSLAAHPGRPKILTQWLDPSVIDESDPLSVDPELDMYNPDNGPPYSPEFLERYRAAQVARNDHITAWALSELDRIRDGRPRGGAPLVANEVWGAPSVDGVFDRFFTVPREFADPRFVDLSIDPSERAPGCFMGDPLQANYSGYGLAAFTTAREWVAMWSLSHSQIRIEQQLPLVTQPAMMISANHDQGCFPSHAQEIYDAVGSKDKQLITLPGGHYFEPPHSDRDRLADLIADWLEDHRAVRV